MKFTFDQNHPPPLAAVLQPLAIATPHTVDHVFDLGLQGASDVDLLAALAAGGSLAVLITVDRRMTSRPREREALLSTGVVLMICARGWERGSMLDRARRMVWSWPRILETAESAPRASCWEVPWLADHTRPLKHWKRR